MSTREIGCCGAYCKTCLTFSDGSCRSCKLGYDTITRGINKTKCKIKVCCLKEMDLETCADCPNLPSCKIIQYFFNKNDYKYRKYRQSIEFIRKNGYPAFIAIADNWKGAYRRLDFSG